MTKEKRTDVQIYSAWFMLVFGAGLTVAGFIVPPLGDISDPVLWVFSQTLLYAGGIFGAGAYMKVRFQQIEEKLKKKKDDERD